MKALSILLAMLTMPAMADVTVVVNSTATTTFTATATLGTATLTSVTGGTGCIAGMVVTGPGLPATPPIWDFIQIPVTSGTITMSALSNANGSGTYTCSPLQPIEAKSQGFSPTTYFNGFTCDNLLCGNNPGFQGIMRQGEIHEVHGTGTTTSFNDQDPFSTITANFAAGWAFSVIAHYNTSGSHCYLGNCYDVGGGAYGCYGTVASNTVGSGVPNGNGPTFNLTVVGTLINGVNTLLSACPAALAANDVVALSAPGPLLQNSQAATRWTLSGPCSLSLDTTTGNLPPSVGGIPPPTSIMQLNATSSGACSYSNSIDATQSVLMNGTTTQTLMVKLISGSVGIAAKTFRVCNACAGGIGQVFIDTTATPQALSTGAWSTKTLIGAGTENGSTDIRQGIAVQYVFTSTGTGVVDIIAASLTGQATNGGAYTHTNGTTLSDQTVANLRAGKYDGLRWNYTSGGGNYYVGCPLIELLQFNGYAKQCNLSTHNYTNFAGTPQNLNDFILAATTLGMHNVEYSFGPASLEQANIADYLNGNSGTTYGAYRIALGGPAAGWNSLLNSFTYDWNETWNGKAGVDFSSNNYTTSLGVGVSTVNALIADSNWNTAKNFFAFPVQPSGGNVPYLSTLDPLVATANPQRKLRLDSSFYYTNTTGDCSQPQNFKNGTAEAQANAKDSALVLNGVGTGGWPTIGYEGAGNGQGILALGNCQAAQTIGLFRGLGGALTDMEYVAQLQRRFPGNFRGMAKWSYSDGATAGYTSTASTTPATSVDIWSGFPSSLGIGANPSAGVYGDALYNACAKLGTGIIPTFSGMPTLAVTAANGIPAETIDLTPVFACSDGATKRSFLMENNDTTTSHTVTLSPATGDTPTGTVTITTLRSHAGTPALSDNNDTVNSAAVVYPDVTTGSMPSVVTLAPMTAVLIEGIVGGSSAVPNASISGTVTLNGTVVVQ